MDEMAEFGTEFDPADLCCVANGGHFAGHLQEQREEAELVIDDNDPSSFHAVRDPNVNFRYRLYVHFIAKMELLGRGRVQIPLCYMNAVREIWPSRTGIYVGYYRFDELG